MASVYHQVLDALVGETLYPLSELEYRAPKLYWRQLAKYGDHPSRKHIPYQRITKLNCARRDVLNFSPLHPCLVHSAWRALGVTLPSVHWYQLPVGALLDIPAVVYRPTAGRTGEDIPEEATAWLNPATYREITELSEETRHWYAELCARGAQGGWFACIPHVLVRGKVSVKDARVIDWQDKNK